MKTESRYVALAAAGVVLFGVGCPRMPHTTMSAAPCGTQPGTTGAQQTRNDPERAAPTDEHPAPSETHTDLSNADASPDPLPPESPPESPQPPRQPVQQPETNPPPTETPNVAISDGDAVLNAVVRSLPSAPIRLTGTFLVRRRRGTPVRNLRFEMQLRWGDPTPTATYIVANAQGEEVERLVIARPSGLRPVFAHYFRGIPTDPSVMTFDRTIQGSDITWLDLSLSFLWWRGAGIVGEESIRGRNCYIVEVQCPETERNEQYARVRLWIDRELYILLRAEGYDETNALRKEFWVHSFRKIDDEWMIKDIEVQSHPSDHRTKLTIEDVGELAPP